jgi:hypothetical protein
MNRGEWLAAGCEIHCSKRNTCSPIARFTINLIGPTMSHNFHGERGECARQQGLAGLSHGFFVIDRSRYLRGLR